MVDSALRREARLLDEAVLGQRRLRARRDASAYLSVLQEDDKRLVWECTARGLKHVQIEAAVRLQHGWRNRGNKNWEFRRQALKRSLRCQRKLLAEDMKTKAAMREDLRAEALAFFETAAPPLVKRLAQLRRNVSHTEYHRLHVASTGKTSGHGAGVPTSHAHSTVAAAVSLQSELFETERRLFRLQEQLFITFFGPKEGREKAAKAKLDPAAASVELMQSQVRTPEELNGFKHTLGASTAGDSDAAARLREAIEQEKVMERRRLLVAAVRTKPIEGAVEKARAVRDEMNAIEATHKELGRVRKLLRRMANNQLTADDHGALKAIVATASTATPLPSSDALSRALQVWLPDNYAELLGVAPAPSTPEKTAEAAPAATGDKAAAPAAGPRPMSPPLKATPKRRPWTADTCSRTPLRSHRRLRRCCGAACRRKPTIRRHRVARARPLGARSAAST